MSGGSISTASRRPMISVEVIGDHIRVLPSGSGPRPDCGICFVTKALYSQRLAHGVTSATASAKSRIIVATVPGYSTCTQWPPLSMTFTFGLDEARADGIDELLGHEAVGAAADDQYRAAECARGGGVAQPVVPDVDVVGGDVGCDGGADVGRAGRAVRR